jgi:hypothetical protein
MRFIVFGFVAVGLVVASGCADASTGTGGNGGSGGAGGNIGAGGSGDDDCDAVERTCQVLDEIECVANEECQAVAGTLWRPDVIDCFGQPREFIGCRGGCLASPTVGTCIYHPSDPSECYCIPEASVLTGWEELFECDVPEGFCGR